MKRRIRQFKDSINHKLNKWLVGLLLCMPLVAHADNDPFSKTAGRMSAILFGPFGTTIASILLAATFVMAKVGKVSWDKFLFIGFCTAGFLGSQSIIGIIKGLVGNGTV